MNTHQTKPVILVYKLNKIEVINARKLLSPGIHNHFTHVMNFVQRGPRSLCTVSIQLYHFSFQILILNHNLKFFRKIKKHPLLTDSGEKYAPYIVNECQLFVSVVFVFQIWAISLYFLHSPAENFWQPWYWGLIEKSIISRSAKDTALGSMIELTVGFYGRHKRKKQWHRSRFSNAL